MSKIVTDPSPVVRKFLAKLQYEGEGATVRRSIGRFEMKYLDPFLLLDEFSVSAPAGFPDHPHRGFETVTYMLDGAIEHEDCEGNKGTIKAGDLQWMTAGRGIIHSEMPSPQGTQIGLQLWINLSSTHKMIEPMYQEMKSKDISEATDPQGKVKVRVIAGESMGIKSPIYTRTPTMFLDFTIKPGGQIRQYIPSGWTAFVYVLEGEGIFGNSHSLAHHLLVLGNGDGLVAGNGHHSKAVRFVVVAGRPLGEAVARWGPFVMNSEKELDEAVEDYENSKNGFEKAGRWKSESAF